MQLKPTYKLYTKCCKCGHKVFSPRSKYCRNCHKIKIRMKKKKFTPQAQEGVWDYISKYGHTCYYTKMALEMEDDTSPWYLDFDHWIPGDPRKIVICSALVNDMKQDMTEFEFWYYVFQLDDHRKKHTKVRKRRLIYWYRLLQSSKGHRHCPVCGRKTFSRWHKFCSNCSTVAKRMIAEHFPPKTKNDIFSYLHNYGPICCYTGMRLELFDVHSAWYLTFDHWKPNDPRKIVLTSRMVNAMKQDLLENEFWYIISQLANHKKIGTPFRKIKLKFWSRPYGR